ncbi:unnamed protein product [Rangifer tarandus platyrhynchus]|uniref:Voltage-dependent calcium channel alpha-2/delta subunit conserved region domain-containing protein n=1 Tax=Rangifer tarandus platyrhynchus TaxID=3082113 RepID=A0ABN8YZQ8_RANTA|nr:unnamed protein product [Rangifer tarandus platyrhynchus]
MPTSCTPSPLDICPRMRLLHPAFCGEVKVTEARGRAEANAQGPEGSASFPPTQAQRPPVGRTRVHTLSPGGGTGLCPPPATTGLAFRALPASSLPSTRNTRGSSSAEAGRRDSKWREESVSAHPKDLTPLSPSLCRPLPRSSAAVGIQMRMEFLQRSFWAATQQCGAAEGPCQESCRDSDLDCFIVDNNGFILISERPQEVGRFLGEVDGALVTQLLSMGVFSQVTMYDYQAMCRPPTHHHSASQPLVSPISALLKATRWLVNELLLLLLEWRAWGSWRGDHGAEAKTVFHHSHKHKKQDLLQPCDTAYPVFVHQTAVREANGTVECRACQKSFVMQQVPSSNLLLLVTDRNCDCSIFPPVLREAEEVKYILWGSSLGCNRMRSQKLRRRPDTCHAFHPEENAQDCGGASDTSASLPLLLLPLWAWVLPSQLLR